MKTKLPKVARVFPRKTKASPDDDLAFFGPPGLVPPEVEEVHVSVTFTYDIPVAEQLAKQWEHVAPVKIGGPAMGDPGGDFVPGMYLKLGYVITSRGCPNNCWFCVVPKREGPLREIPVTSGHILQDDNILACSTEHIQEVFAMLKAQEQRVELMGLEAARLTPWVTDLLWDLRPKQMFFAYDTPDDLEPLVEAGKLLQYADFTRSHLRCYVLIGYPRDTFEAAEKRLIEAWSAGFLPCAMLYHNRKGETSHEWQVFQRTWMRPAATRAVMKGTCEEHFQLLREE